MQRREVEIVNAPGLDARASAEPAQLATNFRCDVSLMRRGRKINAKSLMGVMMLAAGQGSRVVVETEDPDENEALDAITALIGSGFRENKKPAERGLSCCIELSSPPFRYRRPFTVRYARQGSTRKDRCQRQSPLQLRRA